MMKSPKRSNALKNSKGSAIIATAVAVLAIGFIATSTLHGVVNETAKSTDVLANVQAQYISNAGLQVARYALHHPVIFVKGEPSVRDFSSLKDEHSFAGGKFILTFDTQSDVTSITSKATNAKTSFKNDIAQPFAKGCIDFDKESAPFIEQSNDGIYRINELKLSNACGSQDTVLQSITMDWDASLDCVNNPAVENPLEECANNPKKDHLGMEVDEIFIEGFQVFGQKEDLPPKQEGDIHDWQIPGGGVIAFTEFESGQPVGMPIPIAKADTTLSGLKKNSDGDNGAVGIHALKALGKKSKRDGGITFTGPKAFQSGVSQMLVFFTFKFPDGSVAEKSIMMPVHPIAGTYGFTMTPSFTSCPIGPGDPTGYASSFNTRTGTFSLVQNGKTVSGSIDGDDTATQWWNTYNLGGSVDYVNNAFSFGYDAEATYELPDFSTCVIAEHAVIDGQAVPTQCGNYTNKFTKVSGNCDTYLGFGATECTSTWTINCNLQ